MMGGNRGKNLVFQSSDSDDADWQGVLGRDLLKHRLGHSNTSSASSTPQTDSLDDTAADVTYISKTLRDLHPTRKRPTSESADSNNFLSSKRNCQDPHLHMGNGFRHERVGNNNNNTNGGEHNNTDSSKSSEMSWQSGKQTERNHHPTLPQQASSSSNQPSGSGQDTSSRQPRYHNRPSRRNLILSSDSDDDDWTERTSDNATFQSHSNSPDPGPSQQRSKRFSNNQPRKSKTGYLNRPGRELVSNNGATVPQSSSQINKESGTSNGIGHHNNRVKWTTTSAGVASGASAGAPNEAESQSQTTGASTTPKNRHVHRLRMHQNRQAGSGATSFMGNSESESFASNLPFRRDDPGRRAFSRSGHPLHGRRSQGSPHHHRPLLRGQESPFSSLVRRHPDLFESESTDDGSDLFAGGTNSLTRNSFRQTSPLRHRNSFQYQSFNSATLPENDRDSSGAAEEQGITFVPDNRVSPMARHRRRDQGRFTSGSGGRRRRSSRSSHLLSGERSILSSSPDPVAQVNQMEEDERLARLLQAEFDAELSHHHHSDGGGHVYHSESDAEIFIDEEETLSSLSSSSSNAEDTSYGGRHGQHQAQVSILHQINLGGRGGNDLPARGRRRGTRSTNSTPPVLPPRHWHGSPVRGRRGRTRSSPNADPLMLQFGRWLGWALIRNLDTEEDDYEVLWNLAESMGEAVPRGLQRHEINRLPTHKYQPAPGPSDSATGGGTSSNNNNVNRTTTFTEATRECRVCLCDYEPNELLRVLPCFHEFHAVCIDKWLKNSNTCPVCRAEVSLDS